MFVPQRRRRPTLWNPPSCNQQPQSSDLVFGSVMAAQGLDRDLREPMSGSNQESDDSEAVTESDGSTAAETRSACHDAYPDVDATPQWLRTPRRAQFGLCARRPVDLPIGLAWIPEEQEMSVTDDEQAAESIAAAESLSLLDPDSETLQPVQRRASCKQQGRYHCRFCNQRLSTSSNCRRHERSMHKEELERMGLHPKSSKRRNASLHVCTVTSSSRSTEYAQQIASDTTSAKSGAEADDAEPRLLMHDLQPDHDERQLQLQSLSQTSTPEPDDLPSDSEAMMQWEADEVPLHMPSPSSSSRASTPTEASAIVPEHQSDPDDHPERRVDDERKDSESHAHAAATSTAAPTAEDAVPFELAIVEGARPLLQESQLEDACKPFLEWLSNPPVTQCEALVKARRVKTEQQRQPIRSNLRFIFTLLYECQAVTSVDLSAFAQLEICQKLYQAFKSRGVGSGRIHAIFLCVKKVLVYLSSLESTRLRQFVQPTSYDSYLYVDNVCSESSAQRKQEARNRAVLGAAETYAIRQQEQQLHQPRRPSSAAASMATTRLSSAPGRATESSVAPPTTMSKSELKLVTSGCLSQLERLMRVPDAQCTPSMDQLFVHYLVTATLCLGMAPRSQILRQLRIGTTFLKDDGFYWLRALAEMCKNGKPIMIALALELTSAFDHYLAVIRPRLLHANNREHDYVFFKRNGEAPRIDFSSSTTFVTQQLVGRPINPHAFRSAVITTFYEAGATQSDMDFLARLMAHDASTARNVYYQPVHSQAAVSTSQRMVQHLLA